MSDGSRSGVNRRRFLAAVGATGLGGGLAGCTGLADVRDAVEERAPVPTATSEATPAATATESETDSQTDAETEQAAVEGTEVAIGDCGGVVGTACERPTVLSSNVTEDATLGAECDRYVVEGEVEVTDGARLTVEPGTEIRFRQDAGLKVLDDAELVAVGTCEEPILFAGEQETRGFWRGVYFQKATSTANRLAYCVVEHGGSEEYWKSDVPANLAVTSGSRVSVTNCAFREGAGYGFTFTGDVHVDSFAENVVAANAEGAGHVRDASAHLVDGSGTYAGNDEDRVAVWKRNSVPEDAAVTWDALDVPYRVYDGDVEVYGELTVEHGATLAFEQDSGMKVWKGGSLSAVGIEPSTERLSPVTFTGVQKTRGFWHGIYFHDSDRTENQLRSCVVEYGGGEEFWHADVPANVAVAEGSRVRVDGCTFRESAGYGFTYTGDVSVDSFTQNTVTANADGAGYVHDATAHFLSDTGTYTGNDDDAVLVRGHRGVAEGEDVSWDAIDVPYRVVDDAVEVDGQLTIEPGATVEFAQELSIKVWKGGSLTAVGMTPDEAVSPVTFTGVQKTPGYWQGLYFDSTDRVENHLAYCVVEYGGSEAFWHADEPANVAVAEGARLRLLHATLRESGGYGLFRSGDSDVTAVGNTLERNERGPELVG